MVSLESLFRAAAGLGVSGAAQLHQPAEKGHSSLSSKGLWPKRTDRAGYIYDRWIHSRLLASLGHSQPGKARFPAPGRGCGVYVSRLDVGWWRLP